VAAVAAIIATMLLDRSSAPDSTVVDGGLLYPNLKSQLNGIERLEVSGAGPEDPIALERSDSGWVVLQKAGYAADAGKIRQLLLRLAEASIVEAKTANPDLYARLAVADLDAPEGAGTLLTIGPPADIRVVVGERDARAGGTYVRRAGEAQSYLVDADIAKRQTASVYLKQLCDLGVLKEVKSGRENIFVHPKYIELLTGEENVWIYYADTGDHEVDDLPD
jgi:hypothetical protein